MKAGQSTWPAKRKENKMKKLLISLLAVVFLISCSGITTSTQTMENIALQLAAQRIGYQVAKSNPSIVPQAKLVAQGILAGQTVDLQKAALQDAMVALTAQFRDPLLLADAQIVITGLGLATPTVGQIPIPLTSAQLTPIINAFIVGMGAVK
jgi:hypothetical protein